jgi:DNA-binding response OmpR family regulator
MGVDNRDHEPIQVLLIEDSPEHAILVRSYLAAPVDLSLDIVETLAKGEERLAERDYRVVLLDLFLPDSSGLATLRRLLHSFPSVSVIVLTGLEGQDGVDGALGLGAVEFLTKSSLTSKRLLAAIRSITSS